MTRRPVIAIAGLAIEASGFTPARSGVEAFHVRRGDVEIRALYPFLAPGTLLGDRPVVWRGVLVGRALPGGPVLHTAYEKLVGEMVQRLAAMHAATPVDGVFLDVHGAMVVDGVIDDGVLLDDPELDMVQRVRAVVGPGARIAAALDLHGNVSRGLVHALDMVTCFRTAPHEDEQATRARACGHLVDALLLHQSRPVKAWVPVPVLLPGEQTSTRDEPAAGLYAAIPAVLAAMGPDHLLDAAVWVGYAWADAPRNRAAVVVTGWDTASVAAAAEQLARRFWHVRRDFHFAAPTGSLDACLRTALAADPDTRRPFFVSDSGDNPTAGGSGDVPWGLAHLLALFAALPHPPPSLTILYASLPAAGAVHTAVAAGVGSTITVSAGADVDSTHGGPVSLTGTVHALKHGDPHAHTEAVLRVCPAPGINVFVILTEHRKPYHLEHDFTDLCLSPRSADIVVVKIGYLEPELYNMAADWMLALTPGGVDQDLLRLGHHRIRRPMFPFDATCSVPPELSARIIPPSDEPLVGPDE